MAGYKIQGQLEDQTWIDIPLAATHDSEGNNIAETYALREDCQVIRDKLHRISGFLSRDSINVYSWDAISTISQSGKAASVFHVGQEKDITLSTGEEITMVILGFDHDDLSDGSGKAGITLGMKNCLETMYPMNTTATNAGGWNTSGMRDYLHLTLYGYLPQEVQRVIKYVHKKTSAGSTSSSIDITSDKLFLFSAEEVMGTNNRSTTVPNSFSGEGSQYEYFKNAPIPKPTTGEAFSELAGTSCFYTTDTAVATGYVNRLGQRKSTLNNFYYNYNNAKARSNTGKTATEWWLRSPSRSYSGGFCSINVTGDCVSDNASFGRSVAFGFCV